MNNIQSSSLSKIYSSLYDYAYELEYGCVLIMFIVYVLVLSSCAMFLICSALFFIVHQISMIRIRIRNQMVVHCAVCWVLLTSLPKVDSFLNLITVPKMPNLSLIPLKPSCHPQHDTRNAVLKYEIAHLNK